MAVELKFRNLFLNHVALAGDRTWTTFYKEQGERRGSECIPILLTISYRSASYSQSPQCRPLEKRQGSWRRYFSECTESKPYICEREVFRFPDGDHCTEMGKHEGGRAVIVVCMGTEAQRTQGKSAPKFVTSTTPRAQSAYVGPG